MDEPQVETTRPSGLEQHTGYIALFDILGYLNFLATELEAAEQAVDQVLSVIATLDETILQRCLGTFRDYENMAKLFKSLRWLIFSDTVVVAAPVTGDAAEDNLTCKIVTVAASVLQRFMFDFGLPLRGAITYGRFTLHSEKICFAGRPIVEAYQLSQELDLAACVLSPGAVDHVIGLETTDMKAHKTEIIKKYHTPMKGGLEPRANYIVIPSMWPMQGGIEWHDKDVKQLVAESFWRHGKKLPPSAMSKLEHTEMLFRYLKMEMKNGFK